MENEFGYSSSLACISLAIFLLVVVKYRKIYMGHSVIKAVKSYGFVVLYLTLYSVFAFAEADTYHYMGLYEDLYKTQFSWHVEPAHFWIIKHLPHGYYIWRLFIWGISAMIFVKAFKYLKISADVAGFVIAIIMLNPFSQTRGTLGFSIMMFALSYYVPFRIGNVIRFVFVGLTIALSTFFHKSLGIYALLFPLAVLLPYNKKTIILSLILFPVFYTAIYTLSSDILGMGFLGEQTIDRGASYLERESEGTYNIYGILTNSIMWIALFLYFQETTKYYLKNTCNKVILYIQKYTFVLVYISFLFYGQNISSFLYTRTLHFAMFPLAISFAYYLQNSTFSKMTKWTMFFFFLNTLYEITYHIYKFY